MKFVFAIFSSVKTIGASLVHKILQFFRFIWRFLVVFIIANKVYIGWGLVIIVPVAGLIVLFIYLANRPKEEAQPYIQTNQPRSLPPEATAPTFLYVTHANGYQENIPMIYNRMIIGTNPTCQIVLQDNNIADQHAEIYTQEGRYFVRDYNTGYPTYVNSTQITGIVELFAGYYVQMGGSTIQL